MVKGSSVYINVSVNEVSRIFVEVLHISMHLRLYEYLILHNTVYMLKGNVNANLQCLFFMYKEF